MPKRFRAAGPGSKARWPGLLAIVSQIPRFVHRRVQIAHARGHHSCSQGLHQTGQGVSAASSCKFVTWGVDAMWELLEIVFDVVSPGACGYIQKTGAALKSILKNPLPFVGNLVKAAKPGFKNFAGNFLDHLKKGLIDWLTGSLEGVYIPTALTLIEFGKLALSVLGISWAQIRGKIVKALGPSGELIMQGLEAAFDVIKALVTGGPAAAWEVLKDKLTGLKDQIVSGITSFVIEAIVTKAVPKLVAMFIPGAGFISAIISIYDMVKTFIEKISKIIAVVTAFINSIVEIAAGNIGAAAAKVESILGGLLSLAISFLAGFVGLGKVASKVRDVITKIRAVVDKALDTAINFIIGKAKALFKSLFSGKPDARTDAQKKADLKKAMQEAETLQRKPNIMEEDIRKGLPAIKARYKMASLELIVDNKNNKKEKVHISGVINPPDVTSPTEIDLEPDGDMKPFKISRPTFTADIAAALNPAGIDLKAAKLDRRHIVSSKDMAEHYETCLVAQKKWSKAKTLLESKTETVGKPLSNEAIETTAKSRHTRFFNDEKNLFLGGSSENRSLGRRLDPKKPGMTPAALADHIADIKHRWALDNTLKITGWDQ